MIISASKTCQLSYPQHKAFLKRETSSVFPPALFTQACDFPPSHSLLSSGCCHSLSSSCSFWAPDLTKASGSSGSLPLLPDYTYRAAQTIWFHHRRSNLGRSYSHSASGLCKNLPGLPLASSQHYKPPRTQKPVFLALG